MEGKDEVALDEIQWRSPAILQEYGGFIHPNNIHFYFSRSPFFDPTSNNAIILAQAQYSANLHQVLATRETFEGHIRSMAGLEFMVTQDPSNNGRQMENSGVWVMRKQNRRKRAGLEDEVTPVASYFVVGENVYMAPTLLNILSSRMMSTVSSLNKLLALAAPLPRFTPSQGHTYLPPPPSKSLLADKPLLSTTATQTQTQTSKEPTPLPSTPLASSSLRSKTSNSTLTRPGTLPPPSSSSSSTQGSNLLLASLSLSLRYGGEYMDQQPLTGEPGNFVIQKARDVVPSSSQPSQPSQQQQMSQQTSAGAAGSSFATTAASTSFQQQQEEPPEPAKEQPVLPPPLRIEPGRKQSIKGGERSPVTPGGMGKKRKKSRVAVGTPT